MYRFGRASRANLDRYETPLQLIAYAALAYGDVDFSVHATGDPRTTRLIPWADGKNRYDWERREQLAKVVRLMADEMQIPVDVTGRYVSLAPGFDWNEHCREFRARPEVMAEMNARLMEEFGIPASVGV